MGGGSQFSSGFDQIKRDGKILKLNKTAPAVPQLGKIHGTDANKDGRGKATKLRVSESLNN